MFSSSISNSAGTGAPAIPADVASAAPLITTGMAAALDDIANFGPWDDGSRNANRLATAHFDAYLRQEERYLRIKEPFMTIFRLVKAEPALAHLSDPEHEQLAASAMAASVAGKLTQIRSVHIDTNHSRMKLLSADSRSVVLPIDSATAVPLKASILMAIAHLWPETVQKQ